MEFELRRGESLTNKFNQRIKMKILLINGGAPFNGNGGKLSKTLHELAKKTLQAPRARNARNYDT